MKTYTVHWYTTNKENTQPTQVTASSKEHAIEIIKKTYPDKVTISKVEEFTVASSYHKVG